MAKLRPTSRLHRGDLVIAATGALTIGAATQYQSLKLHVTILQEPLMSYQTILYATDGPVAKVTSGSFWAASPVPPPCRRQPLAQ